MRKSIRPLIAMTAALALTVTAGMSALAQADNTDKHFSVIEAASNEDSLTIPEIAKKCGTSVVAIETETKVVYNTYDNNYYNPFGGRLWLWLRLRQPRRTRRHAGIHPDGGRFRCHHLGRRLCADQ